MVATTAEGLTMRTVLLHAIALCLYVAATPTAIRSAERPNVILMMVDDMGFSDLGYHGSEIDTPNIDSLARGGVRFSQFYNSGRCCPTRATLMTGLHPHQTGIGWMTQPPDSDRGRNEPPAYQGYLNRRCATLGEVMRRSGYATLMAGKWHLGYNDKNRWPLQRGFDKFFGCISGATRFFHPEHPRGMTFGNEDIENPESTTAEAFYTTDAYTDYAMRFIREHRAEPDGARPFFLYLAYTAPHWPLQAFEDDIAKYRGRYRAGWDALRSARLQRQQELGLIDSAWKLSPRTPAIPDWDSLSDEKRDEMDLKMAVYAAMIDRIDQNVGRLVDFLKAKGVYENTLILFLSDNGGCQEGGMLGRGEFRDVERRNQQAANSYGEAWANASNTPFRLYKHFAHEGGTATPFFMHWPAGITPRRDWYSDPAQLIDLMPTLLDVAGGVYPKRLHGNDLPTLDGVSLRPAFSGQSLARREPIFVEHENNAFVRTREWKLVGRDVSPRGGVVSGRWELYNMLADRTETDNLAAGNPVKVKELAAQWQAWSKRVGVYPKGPGVPAPAKASAAEQADSPQVAGRSFTVTATVRQPAPEGVVLSHGGVQFGYALYFKDGKPAFAFRNRGKLIELRSAAAVSGKVDLAVRVDARKLQLFVDGKLVDEAESGGLLAKQPGIGLYLGEDFKDPVGSYRVPNKFNGKLLEHRIEVAE